MTLIHSDDVSRRSEGLDLLASARDLAIQERCAMSEVAIIDVERAAESARTGELDSAITQPGGCSMISTEREACSTGAPRRPSSRLR